MTAKLWFDVDGVVVHVEVHGGMGTYHVQAESKAGDDRWFLSAHPVPRWIEPDLAAIGPEIAREHRAMLVDFDEPEVA